MIFSNDIKIKPTFFSIYSSTGSDWIYQKTPLTYFGAGLKANFDNDLWNIDLQYTQLGFFGEIKSELYHFSPIKSLPYLDKSKDAPGYWSEYINARIAYTTNVLEFDFGIFDRHWGYGVRALQVSSKAPSYPQFGLEWKLNENLILSYFHGFLNSGIEDSSRMIYYDNDFSHRTINIPRSIASHKIEWSPTEDFSLSLNETVIYASRSLDIHYLIPMAPFYPIENYLGDTDNLQMGFDMSYKLSANKKIYLGFFMDEVTPEWILNEKNHNWFAWQIGINAKKIRSKDIFLTAEYNWTDQRIYKHKYNINDYYSHNSPLGFWAGPHSEELLLKFLSLYEKFRITFEYSYVKRGSMTREMINSHYNDTYDKRYENGYQKRAFTLLKIDRLTSIDGLELSFAVNNIKFINSNFILNESDVSIISIDKLAIEIGVNYNH